MGKGINGMATDEELYGQYLSGDETGLDPYNWQDTSKKSLQYSDATGCHSRFGFHSS